MDITQRLRLRHGLRWEKDRPSLWPAFKAAMQLVAGLAALLLVHGLVVERDLADRERTEAKRQQATATQAMKALQDCLNGKSIALGDDSGKVVSAIFCSASREIQL